MDEGAVVHVRRKRRSVNVPLNSLRVGPSRSGGKRGESNYENHDNFFHFLSEADY
jgi:hypothetical protein